MKPFRIIRWCCYTLASAGLLSGCATCRKSPAEEGRATEEHHWWEYPVAYAWDALQFNAYRSAAQNSEEQAR
jgi:hypothetical protein